MPNDNQAQPFKPAASKGAEVAVNDAKPEDPPRKRVVLSEPTGQSRSFSVVDATGSVTEVRLEPHGASAPVDESSLTDYTRGLIAKSLLRVRNADA